MFRFAIGLLSLLFVTASCQIDKREDNRVYVVGAMRNVMWKGQLGGTIALDTLTQPSHLFGLGPVEYLTGELMVLNGRSYKSSVLTDSSMQVEETFHAKAPFFVYTRVDHWTEQDLPDSVNNIKQLEIYLADISKKLKEPFAFRLEGLVEESLIHVVNLPPSVVVRAPQDAHQGQQNYKVIRQQVTVLGFFSKKHKGIFTHHDSNTHMHLLTSDHTMMGHVDEISWAPRKIKLLLSGS